MSVVETARPVSPLRGNVRSKLVDCDIHPNVNTARDLAPYMSSRWFEHLTTYGTFPRQAHTNAPPYPKAAPDTGRRDAWTPSGGRPGSDLQFMREQHLDPMGVTTGILIPLEFSASRNIDLGMAISHAINDWQLDVWTSKEPRLRGSISIMPENPFEAAKEIDLRAKDPSFVQIMMPCRNADPLGYRRYWPIYEAAVRNNLPIGIHVNTVGGGHTSSGSGWPSFYFQEHQGLAQTMKALAVSFIFEGVFEAFPTLKVVMIEGGVSWAAPLAWRMDRVWERSRHEVQHLKLPPSEYLKRNIWFTSQPTEEPEQPNAFNEAMDWIGWDRLLFSSDYPHWDCDDPTYAFPASLSNEHRQMILHGNATALYGL